MFTNSSVAVLNVHRKAVSEILGGKITKGALANEWKAFEAVSEAVKFADELTGVEKEEAKSLITQWRAIVRHERLMETLKGQAWDNAEAKRTEMIVAADKVFKALWDRANPPKNDPAEYGLAGAAKKLAKAKQEGISGGKLPPGNSRSTAFI